MKNTECRFQRFIKFRWRMEIQNSETLTWISFTLWKYVFRPFNNSFTGLFLNIFFHSLEKENFQTNMLHFSSIVESVPWTVYSWKFLNLFWTYEILISLILSILQYPAMTQSLNIFSGVFSGKYSFIKYSMFLLFSFVIYNYFIHLIGSIKLFVIFVIFNELLVKF